VPVTQWTGETSRLGGGEKNSPSKNEENEKWSLFAGERENIDLRFAFLGHVLPVRKNFPTGHQVTNKPAHWQE